MKLKAVWICLFLFMGQQCLAESSNILIHGKNITCKTPTNKVVLFYDTGSFARFAKKVGGADGGFTPQFGYTISVDPETLKALPYQAGIFTVYHECAHIAMPRMKVGESKPAQEKQADCYALKAMKKDGHFGNWPDFKKAMQAVVSIKGAHTLTPERINAMEQCSK